MEPVEIFVKKAEMRRRELGLTQEDLAERMGMARPSVTNYLKGKMAPGIDTLGRWAKALEVDAGWLISEDKAPPKEDPSERLRLLELIIKAKPETIRALGKVLRPYLLPVEDKKLSSGND